MNTQQVASRWLAGVLGLSLMQVAMAQAPASPTSVTAPPANCAANRGLLSGPSAMKSVEPLADGRVTFRLCAPDATTVFLASTDLPGIVPFGANTPGLAMSRGSDGIWSVTTDKPVPPDNYRYNFLVNGAVVPDPAATTFSKERFGTRCTFEMPGAAGAFQS